MQLCYSGPPPGYFENGLLFKGTGNFFETLSVGSVPGTDLRFFDENPFSMHLYACVSVVFFASVDLSTLAQL